MMLSEDFREILDLLSIIPEGTYMYLSKILFEIYACAIYHCTKISHSWWFFFVIS